MNDSTDPAAKNLEETARMNAAALGDIFKALKTIGFYPDGHPLRRAGWGDGRAVQAALNQFFNQFLTMVVLAVQDREVAPGATLFLAFLLDLAGIKAPGQTPRLDAAGLVFARDGNGIAALVEGWSEPEEWGTWSIARRCVVRVALQGAPVRPMRIGLSCRAFVSAGNPSLRATCRVGSGPPQQLEFSTASFAGVRMLALDPAAIPVDGTVTISFALTSPRSPSDLGLGSDVRPLGIGLERIWLADGE